MFANGKKDEVAEDEDEYSQTMEMTVQVGRREDGTSADESGSSSTQSCVLRKRTTRGSMRSKGATGYPPAVGSCCNNGALLPTGLLMHGELRKTER